MPSLSDATRALELYQDQMLENDNLSYLAIIQLKDRNGNPIDSYTIEAGVENMQKELENRRDMGMIESNNFKKFVPTSIEIPRQSTEGFGFDTTPDKLKLNIIQSKGFSSQNLRSKTRPVSGGLSIGNYRYNDAGTLGEIINLNDEPGLFLISCWHVLCGDQGRINDDIIQPGNLDNGDIDTCKIAKLHSYRLTDQVDVAFAELNIDTLSRPGVMHLGRTRDIVRPFIGMNVIKCGRSTEVTQGRIHSVDATVRINGYPGGTAIFYNQILTNEMSTGGDSGAVLLEENSNNVVGLLIGGNDEDRSIFNHMTKVFSSLSEHTFRRNESLSENQSLFYNNNPNQ